jgi:hypothetical protein
MMVGILSEEEFRQVYQAAVDAVPASEHEALLEGCVFHG